MGQALISTIKANWAVIAQAPWAFILVIALAGGAIWAIINHLKANQISDLSSRLKLRDDEIADYKRKLSGASPDEAKARIDALEERVNRLGPRIVSAEQRQAVVAAVAPGNQRTIEIAADVSSPDANNVARGLATAFRSAGWAVITPVVVGIGNPPPSGIGLTVTNVTALTPDEQAIANGLRVAGLEFDLQPRGGQPPSLPGQPVIVAALMITNPLHL